MGRLLKLLTLATAANCLSWIILTPVWQYPDEQAHFAQVQDLAELGVVPLKGSDTSYEIAVSEKILQTERDSFGNNKFTYHPEYRVEYSQQLDGPFENTLKQLPKETRIQLVKREATHNPPLYYWLSAQIYKLFIEQDLMIRVTAVRIFSAFLFIAMIILVYKAASEIFAENKTQAIVLTSLIATKPMLIFASTGVLPDVLTNLLFTSVLFVSIKILKNGLSVKRLMLIGLAIALGMTTRQQFPIAFLIAAIPISYQLVIIAKKNKILLICLLLAIPIVIYAIFFIPPIRPLSAKIFVEFNPNQLNQILDVRFREHLLWTTKHSLAEVLPWYWGVYKWLSLTVPHIYYQIVNRLIVLAILGIIIKFAVNLRNRAALTKTDLILIYLIVASIVYFSIFLIWDYFLRINYGYSFGIQGRYFFPLILAHMSVIVAGLWQLLRIIFKKYAKHMMFMLVICMVAFNNVSLFYVSSSYYDTSNLATFITQASQYKPWFFKGNVIVLILAIGLFAQALYLTALGKFILSEKPRLPSRG